MKLITLDLFDIAHVLTPLAIVKRVRVANERHFFYTTMHIFGLRVAYWTNPLPEGFKI